MKDLKHCSCCNSDYPATTDWFYADVTKDGSYKLSSFCITCKRYKEDVRRYKVHGRKTFRMCCHNKCICRVYKEGICVKHYNLKYNVRICVSCKEEKELKAFKHIKRDKIVYEHKCGTCADREWFKSQPFNKRRSILRRQRRYSKSDRFKQYKAYNTLFLSDGYLAKCMRISVHDLNPFLKDISTKVITIYREVKQIKQQNGT